MDHTFRFPIDDPSGIGEVRRELQFALPPNHYTPSEHSNLAIIATELGTNLLKHAGGGEILLNPVEGDFSRGAEIIALDNGPGITDLRSSMTDGVSTRGTAGNGLGAVSRISSFMEIYSRPEKGTAVLARYLPPAAKRAATESVFEIGGVTVPITGEQVSGDAWTYSERGGLFSVLSIDGLGHGIEAHRAAVMAVESFHKTMERHSGGVMEDLHGALRASRGAAASLVTIDPERQIVRCSGVGNVAMVLLDKHSMKRMANSNGTLGHIMRHVSEYSNPWTPDSMAILCSDGIHTHWTFDDLTGLLLYSASLIAAVICKEFSRRRDDASVLVVRPRYAER